MMNLNWSLSAENETAVPFNFSLLVKQVLLRPNPYSGLTQLDTPFAISTSTKGDQYLPFAPGATTFETAKNQTTLAGPVAVRAEETPPSTPPETDTPPVDIIETVRVKYAESVAAEQQDETPTGAGFLTSSIGP